MTGQSTAGSITPDALPLFRGRRALKRWRYVGVFGEELMACAARVQVGPARQAFWALYTREEGELRERTRLLRRGVVAFEAGRVRVRDAGVELDLRLEEGGGIEARCPHEGGAVWTRKQAGVEASGTLRLPHGEARSIRALAVIDDTAGYHGRRTEWWWSAGVGAAADGRALAWNVVEGVNDPPSGSERAVWEDGVAHECPRVSFAKDLSRISWEDGTELRFRAEAQRARRDNLVIVRSDYRAPFGSFAGSLPGTNGPLALARGLGVVEHHRARW